MRALNEALFFVCFVVEDDTGEIVFSTFAVVGDGDKAGMK